MKSITLYFLLLFATTSFAQPVFSDGLPINQYHSPDYVQSADIDGDGDIDLVMASENGNNITWYENTDGQGNFDSLKIVTTDILGFTAIRLGDLDGDGDMDIASTSVEDGKIAWYENQDGAGDFGPQQIISTDNLGVRSIELADLDGDNNLDLVAASWDSDGLFWYKNEDGLGNFGAKIGISTINFTDVAVGDTDNDGDLDLVAVNSGQYGSFENLDGAGTYDDYNYNFISQISSTLYFQNIELVDINEDDNLDILLGYWKLWQISLSASNTILMVDNDNGLGDFTTNPMTLYSHDGSDFEVEPIAFDYGDVDNDGDIDIVFKEKDEYWMVNDNGTLGDDLTLIAESTNTARFVHLADLDNDSDQEFIAGVNDVVKVETRKFDADANEFSATYPAIPPEGTEAYNYLVSDFDNNNSADIMVLGENFTNQAPLNLLFNSSNDFNNFTLIESNLRFTEVNAGDLDADGDLDIVATSGFGLDEMLVVYRNDNGQFSAIDSFQIYGQVGILDLDGDNDNDFLIYQNNELSFLENMDGAGSFGNLTALNLNFSPKQYRITDIDNDSDDDIFVVSASGSLYWYESINGLIDFSNENLIDNLSANNTNSWTFGDIDNNGVNNVLIKVSGEPFLNYQLINNNWIKDTLIDDTTPIYHLQVQDLNNDGNLDLVYPISDDGVSIFWEENLGNNLFAAPFLALQADISSSSITYADMDGDGLLDVVAKINNKPLIRYYKNLFDSPTLSGTVFYDTNENALFDANEFGLFNQSVHIDPTALAVYTNGAGHFQYYVDNGAYEIALDIPDNYELTTSTATYSVNVLDNNFSDLNFGLSPTLEITDVSPTLTSAPTRCGFEVPFWLDFTNEGTTFPSGFVALEIDDLTSPTNFAVQPDSIDGNTYYWNFVDMPPTYSQSFDLTLQMPPVNFLGEFVTFTATVFVTDDNGNITADFPYEYVSEINCAYDPNDKSVQPPGVFDENFTLFGEALEYTIRFQNTGTDTAFTVRLEDQLDANLDWSTFQPIATSHPYEVTLSDGGVVEFLFSNILLPDSTTNEVASHGFAKYRIKALNDLPENTMIENTAGIYFDFNPPIITNTTLNTLVSELPTSTRDLTNLITLDIYPNPTQDKVYLIVKDLAQLNKLQVVIRNNLGQLLQTIPVQSGEQTEINLSEWSAGVYVFEIEDVIKQQIIARTQVVKE